MKSISFCDYMKLTLTFDLYASKIAKEYISRCKKGKTNFVYQCHFLNVFCQCKVCAEFNPIHRVTNIDFNAVPQVK